MRITSGSWNGTHTPVVTLKVVKDAVEMTKTIYADDFGTGYDFTYKEMDPSLRFYKFPTGPTLSGSDPPPMPPPAQPKDQIQSIVTYTPYDYQVYWHGEVTCYIDYLIVDGGNSNNLFSGGTDNDINIEVNLFKANSGLGKFKIMDEAYDYQWLPIGYVDQKIRANVNAAGYPSKSGSHYNFAWIYGDEKYTRREIAHTANTQNIMDYYPIDGNTPFPNAGNYTSELQSRIQNLASVLRWNINQSNAYGTPLWYTPQIDYYDDLDNPGINLREPTTNEIKMMVNLSLTYGAKGIFYFLYWSCYFSNYNDQYYGLVNEDGSKRTIIYPGTSYEGNKWETLKSINQNLTTIGPTLINLTWQNAFSIHQGQPTGTFVTSVTTTDAASERYVELGLFKDAANNDYFMLVNRRTLSSESRNITVSLNNSGFKEILEVASGKKFIIGSNGTFTETFSPGEGKLYKVSPLSYSWSGNITVMNTVTVPSGTTLNVSPNTSIFFASGPSLIINGALNAIGTSSNKITFDRVGTSGTWGGIVFNSGSTGNLQYCDIKNAYYGIYTSNSNPIISNCNITNNNYGLKIHDSYTTQSWSNVHISGNNITNNSAYGLYVYNSSPTLSNNTISNNWIGVALWYDSDPIIEGTSFNNNSNYGLACYGSASPNLNYNSNYNFGGYNIVTGNNYSNGAIRITGSSFPNLGEPPLSLGGYNSILNNTGYEVYNSTSQMIFACNNWWGSSSTIYGFVRDIPYLTSDPNPQQKSNLSKPVYAYDKESELPEDLQIANFEQNISEYESSADKFKKHFTANKDGKYNSYSAVQYIKSLSCYLEPKAVVEEIVRTLSEKYDNSVQYELLTGLSLKLSIIQQSEKAIEKLNEALKLKLEEEKEDGVLSLKAMIYIYDLKETEKGKAIFEEIVKSSSNDSPWYELAASELNIISGKSSLPKISIASNLVEIPYEYKLLGNYPNPFNPTTKISYQLPSNTHVSLKIFDLLGREVATLVNEEKQAGSYEAHFDASNLSSGVYLYKISMNNFVKTMKMIVVK